MWVREAWVGVEFDAALIDAPVGMGSARGRRWRRWRLSDGGWSVPASEAVDALRAYDREDAAAWWETKGWADVATPLVFKRSSCEPV